MSIDTTFKPISRTYAVDNSAALQIPEAVANGGQMSFRVRSIAAATQYLAWGATAPAAPTAPAVGTPKINTLGIAAGATIYLELPANSFLIGSIVTTCFEITAGFGGSGG